MSWRPRFAGDGRLRLPMTVAPVAIAPGSWHQGGAVGELGDETYDPFERTGEGLLLAEAFARADLTDPLVAAEWYRQHGAVDLSHFLPVDELTASSREGDAGFQDATGDVRLQQASVRWHLTSLARLSDYLPAPGRTPTDRPRGWDERWLRPALVFRDELVWLGAPSDAERHIPFDMLDSTEPEGPIPVGMRLSDFVERWRQVNAAYQTIIRDGVPLIGAPPTRRALWTRPTFTAGGTLVAPPGTPIESGIVVPLAAPPPSDDVDPTRSLTDGLTSGWWGLAELQRRLIEPYVHKAGEPEIDITWGVEGSGATRPDGSRGPLLVRERRRWSSLLAPVYVQLLEGLRRTTEGHKGAASCKECGQPFLTLDGRRWVFCTDRERLRYGQRERRRRLAAAGPG